MTPDMVWDARDQAEIFAHVQADSSSDGLNGAEDPGEDDMVQPMT